MFPDNSNFGPIFLCAYVYHNGELFLSEIIDADGATRTARVIRLGTYPEQVIPFEHIECVSLREGNHVIEIYGRPPAARMPEWVRYSNVGMQQ
jgi:hypothetical protein